ncbi:MAG: 2-polyprenyl-3-methyl-6-methoxy-1,4-benzoquinone monooxygenase [Gammaproteobacteria bacterium]|jgi:ubiquinone biosynthesis monooxygenase Coq7
MMNNSARQFDAVDKIVSALDVGMRTLLNNPAITERADPASTHNEAELSEAERKHVAGLMRINHCGEVCAQGLYQGQALTARLPEVRDKMEQAAAEENDHLAWTANRVSEMDSHLSLLNPLFYLGSVAIGAAAGLAGDKWSLGFVAETEQQVVKHLESHLDKLPEQDQKSRAILQVMRDDELSHATTAIEHGASELPTPVRSIMNLTSKLMTKTTYWI